MYKKTFNLGLLLALLLITTWSLSSCSDDDNNSSDSSKKYALQISNSANYYSSNVLLSAEVNHILDYFSPRTTGYFEANYADANSVWSKACDSIMHTDFAAEDLLIADSTWIDLALVAVSNSDEGNLVVNHRKIYFPHYVYRIQTSNPSSFYALNVPAQTEVNNIIAAFNDAGQTTFFLKRSDAVARLQTVNDSIMNHNWKTNSLAIQSGTSFTLELAGGTSTTVEPWPVYAKTSITLPHY